MSALGLKRTFVDTPVRLGAATSRPGEFSPFPPSPAIPATQAGFSGTMKLPDKFFLWDAEQTGAV